MSFSKVLAQNESVSVVLSEEAGVFSIGAKANVSLGGGELAGAFKVVSDNSIQLSAIQLGDAGLVALEHAFPSLASAIVMLKGLIDAQAVKL